MDGGDMTGEYEYLGDFSATPAWHTRHMMCHDCRVSWGGCWDNFQCPKCGKGDLPSCDLESQNHRDLAEAAKDVDTTLDPLPE